MKEQHKKNDDHLIFAAETVIGAELEPASPWLVLVVDDDSAVFAATRLVLEHFEFEGRKIKLLYAPSVKRAKELLAEHTDIAAVLLDVVMETDHAGFDVVQCIREDMHNQIIQIILRTGQPGVAPEREVMAKYEINDYKEKTELTADRLQVTLMAALRAYRLADSTKKALIRIADELELRREAEAAQRAGEARLELILNSMIEAVIATDQDRRILQMNPIAETISGLSLAEACGRTIDEVFPLIKDADDSSSTISDQLFGADQQGENGNFMVRNQDGASILVSGSCAPILTRDGDQIGMVTVLRDVTERRQLEDQLLHSRKMDAIGQLAGGVAHDFNNMLSGILGAAELLSDEVSDDPMRAELLKTIIQAAERAGDLTEKLLTFSHKRKTSVVSLDVHEPISEAVNLLIRSINKQIEVDLHLDASPSIIQGDRAQLQNAILNLGINARDAMPDDGRLEIRTFNRRLTEEDCRKKTFALKPGNYVAILARDTGTGIEPELQEKIFEPFFTTKATGCGTGLGLAAVYGFVQEHHGSIELDSVKGQGTTFEILLPAWEKCVEQTPQTVCDADALQGGCILLVDDEEIVRLSAGLHLENAGFSVLYACDGIEAITCYKQHGTDIDLVILDMMMPNMGGKECFYKVREMNPRAKIMIASGYMEPGGLMELDFGTEELVFLHKPFRRIELLDKVAECVNGGME